MFLTKQTALTLLLYQISWSMRQVLVVPRLLIHDCFFVNVIFGISFSLLRVVYFHVYPISVNGILSFFITVLIIIVVISLALTTLSTLSKKLSDIRMNFKLDYKKPPSTSTYYKVCTWDSQLSFTDLWVSITHFSKD